MGRKKLYATEEERKEASRIRGREYYHRHHASICESRRRNYTPVAQHTGSAAAPRQPRLTDEERRVRDRAKSRRYYERHKSEVQARRRGARRLIDRSDQLAGRSNQSTDDGTVWQAHIDYLGALFAKARSGQDTRTFVQTVARRYSANSSADQIYETSTAFSSLLQRVQRLEGEILNQLGVGHYLEDIQKLRLNIKEAIECLDDIWEWAVLGQFHEKYQTGTLRYQHLSLMSI
ncbi:hypothetical protein H1R20_g5858, partial [Candolleomyces eurysporus]